MQPCPFRPVFLPATTIFFLFSGTAIFVVANSHGSRSLPITSANTGHGNKGSWLPNQTPDYFDRFFGRKVLSGVGKADATKIRRRTGDGRRGLYGKFLKGNAHWLKSGKRNYNKHNKNDSNKHNKNDSNKHNKNKKSNTNNKINNKHSNTDYSNSNTKQKKNNNNISNSNKDSKNNNKNNNIDNNTFFKGHHSVRRKRQVEGNQQPDDDEQDRVFPVDAALAITAGSVPIHLVPKGQNTQFECFDVQQLRKQGLVEPTYSQWVRGDNSSVPKRFRAAPTGKVTVTAAMASDSGMYRCEIKVKKQGKVGDSAISHMLIVTRIPDLSFVVIIKYDVLECKKTLEEDKKQQLYSWLCDDVLETTADGSDDEDGEPCWIRDVTAQCAPSDDAEANGSEAPMEMLVALKIAVPTDSGYPVCEVDCLWKNQMIDLQQYVDKVERFIAQQDALVEADRKSGVESDDAAFIATPELGPRYWFTCRDGFTLNVEYGVVACLPCFVGSYFGDGKCFECPPDTYQDLFGQTRCVLCPDGMVTNGSRTFSRSDCFDRKSGVQAPIGDSEPEEDADESPGERASKAKKAAKTSKKLVVMGAAGAAGVLTAGAAVYFLFLKNKKKKKKKKKKVKKGKKEEEEEDGAREEDEAREGDEAGEEEAKELLLPKNIPGKAEPVS